MINVGVLRGGISNEHDISLLSGENILHNLDTEKYHPVDIILQSNGSWLVDGKVQEMSDILTGIDFAFNILHGKYGEDGTIQNILKKAQVPYSGAGATASREAFDKNTTRKIIQKIGFNVPHGILIRSEQEVDAVQDLTFPLIIKPAQGGSSVGVTIANTLDEYRFGLQIAFTQDHQVLVEEYISGREATVGVIDGLDGQPCIALPPIEIIPPPKATFFNREVKYNGDTSERFSTFDQTTTAQLQEQARIAHTVLSMKDYSRSDFIVSPIGIYFLETNNAAGVGFTTESLFPKMLRQEDIEISDFLTQVIQHNLDRSN